MRRVIALLLAAATILTQSGCWEGREINSLAHGLGVGIDKAGDGRPELTAQIVIPQKVTAQGGGGGGGGGGEEPPFWNVSIIRSSPMEASREITTRLGRRIFWGHLAVIVLGEDYARQGISEILDSMSRQWELRRLTFVAVSEGKAKEVLEVQPKLETVPAMAIRGLIHNRKVASEAPGVTLNDLLIALSEEGIEPIVPRVRPVGGKGEGGKDKKRQEVELSGSAVFKRDKMVGWLDGRETRGVIWARGIGGNGTIVVEFPPSDNTVTVDIRRVTSRQSYTRVNGRPAMRVSLRAQGELSEAPPGQAFSKRELSMVEERVAEVIKSEVTSALRKAQKDFKSDVFGFGRTIQKYHPREWKRLDWERDFPDLEVSVDAECKITGTGLTLQPPRFR